MSQPLSQPLETFLMNDQLSTINHQPSTINLQPFYHTNAKSSVEKCLNDQCGFICFQEEDEEFLSI